MMGAGTGPVCVVSVSLGSSKRDRTVEATLLGTRVRIQRIGVDGDVERARALIAGLDGKVAAIGLGGTGLFFVAGRRRYVIEEARRLAEAAKATPVVDGSGLRHTLERETIRRLAREGVLRLRESKVLLVSAVDRYGMAEAFVEAGSRVVFGDLIFALGIPIPLRSLRAVGMVAAVALPVLRRLPIGLLYPTGEGQEGFRPRHGRLFRWADIVAGDFHTIRRYLPTRMDGRAVITDSTTADDVVLLREHGVALLVTTAQAFEGHPFGINVMEAVLVAVSGRRPDGMQPEDILDLMSRLGWRPRVEHLDAPGPRQEYGRSWE